MRLSHGGAPASHWLSAAVLAPLLISLFFAATLRQGHAWGGDFSQYILHARNIAEGRPYGETCFEAEPYGHLISPLVYPPVLPLILAPTWALFGLDLTALKATILPFFFLLLLVYGGFLRSKLSPGQATAGLLVFGLNPEIWMFKDHILSDIPFTAFCYAALGRMLAYAEPATHLRTHWRRAFVLASLTYLAVGCRTAAVVLLPCQLLHELRRRRGWPMTTMLTTGLLAVGLAAQRLLLPSPLSGYRRHLAAADTDLLTNLYEYLKAAAKPWENGYAFGPAHALFLLLSLIALGGFAAKLLRDWGPHEWFGILYGLLILAWPSREGFRFLLPLFPLYVFYLLYGLGLSANHLRSWRARSVLISIPLIAIAVSYAGRYSTLRSDVLHHGVGLPPAQEMFTIVARLPETPTLVLFRRPRVLCLFSNRRATHYPCDRNRESFFDFAASAGLTHVVLDREWDSCLAQLLAGSPALFHKVFDNQRFAVYELTGPPGTSLGQ